jgi:uncharacterized membrane protein
LLYCERMQLSLHRRVLVALAGLSVVSGLLYAAGAFSNRSLQFDYLLWNLFLAWLPLVLAVLLLRALKTHVWSSWTALALTFLWVLLLPNSFYMISDYIHIQDVVRNNVLYDAVMFTSFIFTGVLLGFSSLSMVHVELRRRLGPRATSVIIAVTLFLCSYAIYLGRDLRWNSWDIFTNPAGILFDVSDHLLHPFQNGAMYTTTVSFFVLLGSLYVAGRYVTEMPKHK